MVLVWRVRASTASALPVDYTPYGYILSFVKRENKPKLLNRLNRIAGQISGITRMIEQDRYCIDVLTQLQAARAALARVETEMLRDHLGHCVEAAIVSGDAKEQRQKAAELITLLERSAR